MRQPRIFRKRIIICVLLFIQIIIFISFLLLKLDLSLNNAQNIRKVSFFDNDASIILPIKHTYHTYKNRIKLKVEPCDSEFIDFNVSICYKNGTDIREMLNTKKNEKWNCKCLPNFHGNNCGQPETIWRALLNYRSPTNIKGPRKYKRNILFVVYVDKFLKTYIEILINELHTLVDLFILFEYSGELFLKKQLNDGFISKYHDKILYLNINSLNELFPKIQTSITNLKQESLIAFLNKNEIINKEALMFLQLYDGWPEPLSFRLRWSVYGYFWLHPKKTILSSNIFTLTYLNENWNHINKHLFENKGIKKNEHKKFIIGDLNHFGGWFCQFCLEPIAIINYITINNISISNDKNVKIDQEYLEDLIGNGLYVDGKTELIRTHQSFEHNYAPNYVRSNWNYDWLLKNLYSKIDY